jgi:hypothetical protein
MVWRPIDGKGATLFVEPRVQMLAEAWGPRVSDERPRAERRPGTHRRHHHFHLRLHPAH